MPRTYIASLTRERPGGTVTAHVRGYSDTHVLFDVQHGNDKDVTKNMSRPIEAFAADYGL